jgi:hypothetical protein
MKHVYAILSKTLLMATTVLLFNKAQSQSSSTVATGNCGPVIANFNTNSGGHSSASLHGGMFDSAFYYNPERGYWTDMDDDRMTPPLSPRVNSIISAPYVNPNAPGEFNVGFYYIVPNALLDRFQIRLFQLAPGPGGDLIERLVASSNPRVFADWSNEAPYVDYPHGTSPANPFLTGDSGTVCIRIIDADIINGPNIFYRVEVAYVLNTPGLDNFFAVYDNLQIGGGPGQQGALPVTFMGINGQRVNEGVLVRWDIADEVNVKEYQLEKSTNGASFSTVGSIAATNKTMYGFTDPNAKAPVIYYRVKSVDIDGRTKYTGIIKIINSNSYSNKIKVYPSPAQNQVTVQHSQLGSSAKVTVTTIDGRVIRTLKPSANASNTMIDLTGLSAGTYVLKLEDGKGKTETTTFMKQ